MSGCFEYYADLAEKLDERQYAPLELPMEQFKCNILREPIGVVALITPWYGICIMFSISFCNGLSSTSYVIWNY